MSRIDKDTVRHVALLSRLEVTDDQVDRAARELDAILGYIEKLNELDLTGVDPMSHPLRLQNVFREDRPVASLPPSEALANAPEREGDFFKTPPIIQET